MTLDQLIAQLPSGLGTYLWCHASPGTNLRPSRVVAYTKTRFASVKVPAEQCVQLAHELDGFLKANQKLLR